jgi:hypothetical protein
MASLTLPVPGSYEIVAHAGFIGGSASGVVGCDARHGGASVVAEFQTVAASAYSSLEMHAALVLTGNETGVVTLFCRQATGSTSAAGGANLTAIKVGAVTLQ